MKDYKRIGNYIQVVDERNKGLQVKQLLGLSISKQFIPSVANIVGTDMENYKIIRKNQFACSTMQVRRDKKMPVALLREVDEAIISQAYPIFEVKDENQLLPEYLMMWFSRREFDRNAWFYTDADVRGGLAWKAFEDMQLPIPSIDKQREIVKEYNVIQNRIALNQQLIQKLEETAQAVYKRWFVEGVDLENLPEGWRVGEIKNVAEYINRGITPSYSEDDGMVILNQKCIRNNSIDFEFSRKHNEKEKKVSTEKLLKQFDILVNSTGDGTLGRVGIVKELVFPLTVDSHITIMRTNSQNNPLYVWGNITSRTEEISNLAEGSTGQTELSRSLFSGLPMLIPHKKKQDDFAEILAKPIKHSLLLEQENQKLTELQALLLSKLATIDN